MYHSVLESCQGPSHLLSHPSLVEPGCSTARPPTPFHSHRRGFQYSTSLAPNATHQAANSAHALSATLTLFPSPSVPASPTPNHVHDQPLSLAFWRQTPDLSPSLSLWLSPFFVGHPNGIERSFPSATARDAPARTRHRTFLTATCRFLVAVSSRLPQPHCKQYPCYRAFRASPSCCDWSMRAACVGLLVQARRRRFSFHPDIKSTITV
jgi:hypothetical protein